MAPLNAAVPFRRALGIARLKPKTSAQGKKSKIGAFGFGRLGLRLCADPEGAAKEASFGLRLCYLLLLMV